MYRYIDLDIYVYFFYSEELGVFLLINRDNLFGQRNTSERERARRGVQVHLIRLYTGLYVCVSTTTLPSLILLALKTYRKISKWF